MIGHIGVRTSVEQFPSCPRDKALVALKPFHKTIKCKKGVYCRTLEVRVDVVSECTSVGLSSSRAHEESHASGGIFTRLAAPLDSAAYQHMALSRASDSESESPDCINTACAAAPQRGVICSTPQYTAGTKASAQDATPRNSIFPGWICDLKERFAI
jgi:hypothetical protein